MSHRFGSIVDEPILEIMIEFSPILHFLFTILFFIYSFMQSSMSAGLGAASLKKQLTVLDSLV
jgi:hypothetical protein